MYVVPCVFGSGGMWVLMVVVFGTGGRGEGINPLSGKRLRHHTPRPLTHMCGTLVGSVGACSFFVTVATILGTGILGLPVKSGPSGFTPFVSTFSVCLVMQVLCLGFPLPPAPSLLDSFSYGSCPHCRSSWHVSWWNYSRKLQYWRSTMKSWRGLVAPFA